MITIDDVSCIFGSEIVLVESPARYIEVFSKTYRFIGSDQFL